MFFCCLLLVLVCLQDFTTDAQYPYGPARCCFSYQRYRIPGRLITEYKETPMHCTNPGVIFTIKNGRHVCADPGVEWVKQAMKRFDQRLFESSIIRDEHGHQCCGSFWTHPIPESEIETYEETHISCPKPGVIFTLKNGRHVGADPGDELVQQAMERFDQRLFESTIIRGEHGPEHCCYKFHRNPIPGRLITEYKETHINCTNPGVIFTIKNDDRVCADPGVEWVKQAMERFDQRLFESTIIRDEYGPARCCFKFPRNPIPGRLITEYEETHISCPNPGVIFTLKNDDRVCADHRLEWGNPFYQRPFKIKTFRRKIFSSTELLDELVTE